MSNLKVDAYDDRGTDEVHYGFVYFTDETRVAYATRHGVTDSTGGGPAITEKHRRLAENFLNETIPGWNDPEKTQNA